MGQNFRRLFFLIVVTGSFGAVTAVFAQMVEFKPSQKPTQLELKSSTDSGSKFYMPPRQTSENSDLRRGRPAGSDAIRGGVNFDAGASERRGRCVQYYKEIEEDLFEGYSFRAGIDDDNWRYNNDNPLEGIKLYSGFSSRFCCEFDPATAEDFCARSELLSTRPGKRGLYSYTCKHKPGEFEGCIEGYYPFSGGVIQDEGRDDHNATECKRSFSEDPVFPFACMAAGTHSIMTVTPSGRWFAAEKLHGKYCCGKMSLSP